MPCRGRSLSQAVEEHPSRRKLSKAPSFLKLPHTNRRIARSLPQSIGLPVRANNWKEMPNARKEFPAGLGPLNFVLFQGKPWHMAAHP